MINFLRALLTVNTLKSLEDLGIIKYETGGQTIGHKRTEELDVGPPRSTSFYLG